jgi:ketosteroid isomerase-like protein
MTDIRTLARRCYEAYERKDRQMIEGLVAEDFSFTSPYDDHIDRRTYFERCWPNAERIGSFDFVEIMAEGSRAFVLYEVTPVGGTAFRNAEHLTFRDGKLIAAEVFFGEIAGVLQKP